MKRIKSILTVLMAAIFALSLVPVQAFAAAAQTNPGSLPTTKGKITIADAEDGETYTAYKIFDLVSYSDDNTAAGAHDTDHYSYVIEKSSPWYSFISTYPTSADADHKAFSIDTNHVIDLTEQGLSGTYYVVTVKDDFFGAPKAVAPATADATYDEDQPAEYMADSAEVQAFAKAALKYAKDNVIPGTSATASTQTAGTGNEALATVVWDDIALGWYLVGTTLGSLAALDTTNNTVEMHEKNLRPSVEKKVKAKANKDATRTNGAYTDDSNVWVDDTDYNIGDTVKYRTKVTVKKNGLNYKLHDVMETGLTFVPASVKVYAKTGSQTAMAELTNEGNANYEVKTPESGDRFNDGCTFEVEFKQDLLDSLVWDENFASVIEVEYSATLNANAVVVGTDETPDGESTEINPLEGGSATPTVTQLPNTAANNDNKNTNSTILTFGNGSSTEWDTVTVDTFQFDVAKTEDAATNSNNYNLLAGAEFKLYKGNATNITSGTGDKDGKMVLTAESAPVALIKDMTKTDADVYRPVIGSETAASVAVTTAEKALRFEGLEEGTYWLCETKAPDGYNKLSDLIKVVVKKDPEADYGKIEIDYQNIDGHGAQNTSALAKITGETTKVYSTATEGQGGVHVINKTGAELPSTGGIGTTIFYVAGTVLVVGAVVMLVAKRRMGTEA